ncbi:MAG: hypothetical protein EOO01_40070 [Chitinophagaceae bacterium]|nr:MAG: hypothetical protein EOO01_40070 [Chitinophagaceae bacterium]
MLKIITIVSSLVLGTLAPQTGLPNQQFDSVVVEKHAEVILIPDGLDKIRCFSGEMEIAASEVTLIENGKLHINPGVRKDVKVEVHFKSLSEISVAEDARVMLYELTQEQQISIRLDQNAIFSGRVNCEKVAITAGNGCFFQLTIHASELITNVAKDCKARLGGIVKRAVIHAGDTSQVNALAMRAEKATVSTTGTAKIRTNVSGRITADLDPESSLTCSGKDKKGRDDHQTEAFVVLVN